MQYTCLDVNNIAQQMLEELEPSSISLSSIINSNMPNYTKIMEWRNDLIVALIEQALHEEDYHYTRVYDTLLCSTGEYNA